MNPEHAQIHTIFELMSDDVKYTTFVDLDSRGKAMNFMFLSIMSGSTFVSMGGDYQEFGVDEDAFWDWKAEQEKYGSIVFWLRVSKEIYAISLPRKAAILLYGLIKMSGYEGLKSSWK
jgi:hypothetical protein